MESTGHAPIYAAIVTGVAALIGVLIGGFLQYFISVKELKRKKASALKVVTIFTAEVYDVFSEFSSKKGLMMVTSYNIVMPIFLRKQLDVLNVTILKHDPQIAVDLLWIKQACVNIDFSIKKHRSISKMDEMDERIDYYRDNILFSAKKAIEYSNNIIIRGYNLVGRRERAELFRNKSFRKYIEEKYNERNYFVRHLIKYGLKKI